MFSTISPFLTNSCGTLTPASASTAIYGVRPESAHHSWIARIRYGLVETSAMLDAILAAHYLFRWRQRLNISRPRKHAFSVFHQRRGGLGQIDTVVVQSPQQRRQRDVKHRK